MSLAENKKTEQNCIRFILDGSIITESNIDPTLTLLQYLREYRLSCGTKEGCAEGDCGACTVVVGDLVDGRVRLRSVNACIQFLPMIHGKALFTVESLKRGPGDKLHPVQRAMVDNHASQCGFCSSGFVMSLFALFKTIANPDRGQINDALSGNLCRCTGYRPIIEAAQKMQTLVDDPASTWLTSPAQLELPPIDAEEQALIDRLTSIQAGGSLHLQYKNKHYHTPIDLDDLARLIEEKPEATLIAGNTDVGLWVNKQMRDLLSLISLSSVQQLKEITLSEDELVIGAAVSLTDAFHALEKEYPSLRELFRRFASMPVRNAGTLAGNIANGSPIGDSMPILIALQAELILRKGASVRHVPLDEFYLGYQKKNLQVGEFIQSVHIPRNKCGFLVASYKISKRYDQDISAVCFAIVVGLDESNRVSHIRLACGGMAAIPARAKIVEQALQDATWNLANVQQAMDAMDKDFTPLSDLRASSVYRLRVAKNMLQRFYLESQDNGDEVPLTLNDLAEVSS